MAAAKKAHDEAVAWQQQIDRELLELENEQSKLCATLSMAAGETEKPDEYEIDSNAGWEDMFEEISDENDQHFSGDVQDHYEQFRKTRAALQNICRTVKEHRANRSSSSRAAEQKPDANMEADGEGAAAGTAKDKPAARPSSTDVGGDASRRRVT